ncbi:MAG: hypothetical protein MJ211_06355 [Bacteroidales bacterium]|nr:hypothetical protein [Bacteroidales bacterium]
MEFNPEQPPQISADNQNMIICKNCGAKLTFAPGTLNLKCEFCGAENEIVIDEKEKEEAVKENDFLKALENISDDQLEEVHTVKCKCCGAETTFDSNVISSKCDFCGSPIAVDSKSTAKVIKPKAILPFAVKKSQGKEKFENWMKSLWFAPSDLTKLAAQDQGLSGTYLPFWTYDAKTDTFYTGRRGENYTTTETYKDSQGQTQTREVVHTNWYRASGRVQNVFDDIFVTGTNSLPKEYLESLEPWNLQDLVPYNESFLTGFKTETYSVDLKQGFENAQEKMQSTIDQSIREDIGGDKQEISTKQTQYNDITYKHILLPVWLSAYRYNNKVYRFMINGQSGKVKGERPYSAMKIILFIVAIIAVISLIVMLCSK